jgi:transcription initiation factor IIF auxiliary subunit
MKNRTQTSPSSLILMCGLMCGLFIMMSPAAVAQDEDISTANTSQRVGDDRWEWVVFIRAPEGVLKNIRCVEYKLHSTFTNPNRKVCHGADKKQPFALKANGWGTFDIPIRVTFKDGQTLSLKHTLSFDPSP